MLEALESFGPAQLLRGSFVLYPLLSLAHVLAIGALVTSAVLMDLRVLGAGGRLPLADVVRTLRPVAIGALGVAAVTGLLLFSVQAVDYADNLAFRIKLGLLVLAVANALAFTSLRADRRPERPDARLMALASIALWISVAVAGRFIGFVA